MNAKEARDLQENSSLRYSLEEIKAHAERGSDHVQFPYGWNHIKGKMRLPLDDVQIKSLRADGYAVYKGNSFIEVQWVEQRAKSLPLKIIASLGISIGVLVALICAL